MKGADCIFMGGSLIPCGGHNILEPARLGKPIVFGPSMMNFAKETQLLLQTGGAKQVTNEQALYKTFSDWLAHPQTASVFDKKAVQILLEQDAVLDNYLHVISGLCTLNPLRTENNRE